MSHKEAIQQLIKGEVKDDPETLHLHSGDGLIRGAYLKQMYGEKVFDLFCQVKEIFDPQRIFNPHKKTDANLDYSMKFIKKDNEHTV